MKREEQQKQNKLELFSTMQTLEEQLKVLVEQEQALEQQNNDLEAAQEALEHLEGEKKAASLVQVANGVFLRAHIESFDDVLVNVGCGILVKKKRSDVAKKIAIQRASLVEVLMQVQSRQQMVLDQARNLQIQLMEKEADV